MGAMTGEYDLSPGTYTLIEADQPPSSEELDAAYARYLNIGGDPLKAIDRVISDARCRESRDADPSDASSPSASDLASEPDEQ